MISWTAWNRALVCSLAMTAAVTSRAPAQTPRLGVAPKAADTTSTIPAPTGFVNDFAHVLSAADIAALDTLVYEVKAKCRGEIAVVTIPSLSGRRIGNVATSIGRAWGVGFRGAPADSAANTGVVVLLAPNDRQVHIATADGARVFLSDRDATLISQLMAPLFAKGDYGAGLRLGVSAIAERFATRFGFTLEHALSPADE